MFNLNCTDDLYQSALSIAKAFPDSCACLRAKFAMFYRLSNLIAPSILRSPTFVDRTLRVRSLIGFMIRRFIPAKQKARRHSNCVAVQACPQSDCPTKMIRTYQKNPWRRLESILLSHLIISEGRARVKDMLISTFPTNRDLCKELVHFCVLVVARLIFMWDGQVWPIRVKVVERC
jgi:hypothetical protein